VKSSSALSDWSEDAGEQCALNFGTKMHVHVMFGTVRSGWAVRITPRIRGTCSVTPVGDEGPSLGWLAALPQLREKRWPTGV